MKKGTIGILSALAGALVGTIGGSIIIEKGLGKTDYQQLANKHLAIMELYDQWVKTKQEKKSVTDYFHNHNIKSVAIYGMSFVGQRLYEELKDSDIKVSYSIDKNAASIYADIDILDPNDVLPQTDAIVVTAVYFYNEIEEMLSKKTDIPIISLEDIVCLV